MGDDRRVHPRAVLLFPIGIDVGKKHRIGVIARDVSAGGVMFGTYTRFRLGEELNLSWRAGESDRWETRVRATVVRTSKRVDARASIFPYLTAVRFSEPLRRLPFLPPAESTRAEGRGAHHDPARGAETHGAS